LPALPNGRQAPGGPLPQPLTAGRLAEVAGRIGRKGKKIAVIARNRRNRNVIGPKQALKCHYQQLNDFNREFLSKNLGNERKQTSGKRSE
jgi:hypothetical protein